MSVEATPYEYVAQSIYAAEVRMRDQLPWPQPSRVYPYTIKWRQMKAKELHFIIPRKVGLLAKV